MKRLPTSQIDSCERHGVAVTIAALLSIWVFLAFPSAVPAQSTGRIPECGRLDNAYGPFDYTNPEHRRESLPVVETFHFNDEVFRLEKGLSGTLAADIDYTLRAFPNHHRALDAMARLHRMRQTEQLPEVKYSLTCYFDRAKRMAPKDPVVPMLEGIHKYITGRLDEAESDFKVGLKLAPESAEIHYNLGLLYFRNEDFESAREHAVRAYELGFPLPGLRRKLMSVDQWSPIADND